MESTNLIKTFISCPSDIKDEINSLNVIIDEINRSTGKQNKFIIEALNWNIDTYTSVGVDPQDVINKQINESYDILIGIVWQKIGTPTKRSKSGTIEEIEQAIDNGKNLLVYFNTSPPISMNEINLTELQKINDFKKDLGKKGLLYKEFNSISEFEKKIRLDLINLIHQELLNEPKTEIQSISNSKKNKYSKIESVIKSVEKQDDSNLEIDIFTLVDETEFYLNNISSSLEILTTTSNEFGKKLTKGVEELEKINFIKDERLKFKKGRKIVNLLAGEISNYSSNIKNELPKYSTNFSELTVLYSKVKIAAESYSNEDIADFYLAINEFQDSLREAIEASSETIKTMMGWPPVNLKFNTAKRELENTMKDLAKEMLAGLTIFEEISDS